MTRPRLLDLFCGGGGASMGYFMAGFDVIGVDSKPQPDYPFTFHQMDVRDITSRMLRSVDAVVGSPPCQLFSVTFAAQQGRAHNHVNLIPETRALMQESGLPYVIENVPQAPLISPVTLCGSMFGLRWREYELVRHRGFETNWEVGSTPPDSCGSRTAISVFGRTGKIRIDGKDHHVPRVVCNTIMGTYWITNGSVTSQAIPPVYTAFLGARLRRLV